MKEIISNARKTSGLTQADFAKSLGVSRSIQSQIEIGAVKPSLEYIAKLAETYKISLDEIFGLKRADYGKKSMSKSMPNSMSNEVNEPESLVKYNVGRPIAITVDDKGDENIVLVDVKAAAGYINNRLEPVFYSQLPVFKLPGSEFRNGSFRMFEVQGDSMFNTLWPCDWVIASLVTDPDKGLKNGYIHVIVTKTDIVVKRVLNRIEKRGKLTLLSDNQDYPGYEVDIEDVLEIWYVTRRITAQMPSTNRELQKVITTLKADIINLQERVDKLEGK